MRAGATCAPLLVGQPRAALTFSMKFDAWDMHVAGDFCCAGYPSLG